jgi:hypothetical protein
MRPSDLDIARSAHQWIALHGEDATMKAREMVEAMRRKGDKDGADTWLRIIVAIGTLGRAADRSTTVDPHRARRTAGHATPGAHLIPLIRSISSSGKTSSW